MEFLMRLVALALTLGGAITVLDGQQPPAARQWVDPATGHRVVRLSDEPGSTTLYFHDNAFSASGDKLMLRTPKGIAVVDVAKIGSQPAGELDIVSTTGRGGYFARRGRDIYLSA